MHGLHPYQAASALLQIELIQAFLVLSATSLCVYLYGRFITRQRLPLPPGPPGNILTGNVRSVAAPGAVRTLAGYKDEYGAYDIQVSCR